MKQRKKMDDSLPKTLRCHIDGITYDPVTKFELPDTKVRNVDKQGRFIDEFQEWLILYRHANPWFEFHLLEESQK